MKPEDYQIQGAEFMMGRNIVCNGTKRRHFYAFLNN